MYLAYLHFYNGVNKVATNKVTAFNKYFKHIYFPIPLKKITYFT